MRNLKLQWAINPTVPQTRRHRIQLSKVIKSHTVRLSLEAACTLNLGVYVCGIHRSVSWSTQVELVQGTITTLARRSKISRTAERETHVRKWLRLCNRSSMACVVVQRTSRRVTSAGHCRTAFKTLVAILPALPHCPSCKIVKSGEHHTVVTVCACMTRRQLPEPASSIPRV